MTATVQQLYQLLSSPELRQLQERLSQFNPLQVLGVEAAEIRHSNVLAWLLTPSESHGFGDAVLRGIAARVIVINEQVPEDFDLSSTYFADYSDAEILREWQHIDLLVSSRRNKTVVLIENKIWSSESPTQLSRYYDKISATFPKYKVLPIFLTLEGYEAQNDNRYLRLSHKDIVEIVEHELQSHRGSIPPDIGDFISHYLDTIRRLLGMDEQIEALCRRILKEHSVAMTTLIEVANSRRFALEEAGSVFAKEHPELLSTYSSSKQIWYVLDEWRHLKGNINTGWNGNYPIAVWFSEYYEQLKVVLEVGPIDPPERRLRFIEFLEKRGFRFQNRAKRLEAQYTRVFTSHIEVRDWEDQDELAEKLKELYKVQAKESLGMMNSAVQEFNWET